MPPVRVRMVVLILPIPSLLFAVFISTAAEDISTRRKKARTRTAAELIIIVPVRQCGDEEGVLLLSLLGTHDQVVTSPQANKGGQEGGDCLSDRSTTGTSVPGDYLMLYRYSKLVQ